MSSWLMALGGLTGVGLLAELLIRGLYFRRKRIWRWRSPEEWGPEGDKVSAFLPHPYLSFIKRPGSRHPRYTSNSAGYCGLREIVPEKRGALRIYICGSSTTEQNDYDREPPFDPEATWPERLRRRLAAWYPGREIEVINAACSAYSSIESLIEFALRGVHHRPDIALYYQGINDVWLAQALPGFKSDYSHSRVPPRFPGVAILPDLPWLYAYQYLRFRWQSRSAIVPYLVREFPFRTELGGLEAKVATFGMNVRNFCAICEANQVVPVLIPMIYPDLARADYLFSGHTFDTSHRRRFAELFDLNNCELRKVAQEFKTARLLEPGEYVTADFRPRDWIHWSNAGLDKFADRIADWLRQKLVATSAGEGALVLTPKDGSRGREQ